MHLHSTMLLLIPNYSDDGVSQKTNLHSTMLLLIPKTLVGALNELKFTFHYASTYTERRAEKTGILAQFTFHYASTYTQTALCETSFGCIYIPLCFYLY